MHMMIESQSTQNNATCRGIERTVASNAPWQWEFWLLTGRIDLDKKIGSENESMP